MPRTPVRPAKFTRPNANGLVFRTRLLKLLDRARAARAIWLSAPAGHGKTALVASWIQARKLRCLWYQVDAGDADPAAFFQCLDEAARYATRGRKPPLPRPPPGDGVPLDVFVRRFFAALFGRGAEPFVLVLDGYHNVPADAPLHAIMGIALDAVPEGCCVLFLARREVPPAFARWLVDGRFTSVAGEQLRLTDSEARSLARKLGLAATQDIAALNRRARGWIAGVILLSCSQRSRVDGPAQDSNAARAVFDYFATEVCAKMPPGILEFLMTTAWLPDVTPALAQAVAARADAAGVLAELHRDRACIERCAAEYVTCLARARGVLPECDVTDDWPWPVRIYTLGGFRVALDGKLLAFAGKAQAKPLELLQAAVAHGGRGVSADALIEALWPEAEGDAGRRSFDITLHRLRKLLKREDAVGLSEGKLTLAPAVVWTDVNAFEALVKRIDAANGNLEGTGAEVLAAQLFARYPGEFLSQERVRQWALPRRERLRSSFQRAALVLGTYHEQQGSWQAAADFYRAAIERDPVAEAFYQQLMRCFGRLGLAAEVARTYRSLKVELARSLCIAPSPESKAICREYSPRTEACCEIEPGSRYA